MPLVFECILKFKKDHTFQFLLILMETIFLVKDHLVLKGTQFTTVPEHNS